MKKILSLLLIAALCVSACVFTSSADDAYPESAHDYAHNCEETWTYSYPAAADVLFITFSEETCFAPYDCKYSTTADDPAEKREAILTRGWYRTQGDWLDVYDADGSLCFSETGDDFSGRTICVAGNSFTLVLTSDAEDTAYGFSIDRISPEPPEGYAAVRYHMSDGIKYDMVPVGETVVLNRAYTMRQDGDQMIVGWKTADGGTWYHHNMRTWDEDGYRTTPPDTTDLVAEAGEIFDLYPICCGIAMTKDDVFSFTNSDSCFENGYYFTREHYRQLFTGWLTAFSWTPMAPLAALAFSVFILLWPTLSYAGSCCGFPVTALLQHYGKIDILSKQGVDKVSELKPDDELISTINFYNVQAATCHPVNHMGIERGTEEYTKQLHALYDTLAGGTPVYFELYPHTQHPMQSIATGRAKDIFQGEHGILLTGAYTDPDGNHILIAWENNSTAYVNGRCNVVYINADFTEIYDDDWHYNGSLLDGFSWNDTFEQFDSVPAEGLSNPFAWHIALLKNCPSSFRQIFSLLSRTLGAKIAK